MERQQIQAPYLECNHYAQLEMLKLCLHLVNMARELWVFVDPPVSLAEKKMSQANTQVWLQVSLMLKTTL